MEDSAFIGSAPCGTNDVTNLRSVPKFNERDSDTFFTYSSVSQMQKHRPDLDTVHMPQWVLTGRAHEANRAVQGEDGLDYEPLK